MKQATSKSKSYIPFSDLDYCIRFEIQIISTNQENDHLHSQNTVSENENDDDDDKKYSYFRVKYKNKNKKKEYRNYLVTAIHIYPYEKCEEQSFYPQWGNKFFSSSDIVELLLTRKNTDYIVTNDKITSKILRHVIISDSDNSSHLYLWREWSSSLSFPIQSGINNMRRKLVIWEFLNTSLQQMISLFRRVIDFNKVSKKTKFVAPRTIHYNRKHVKIPALNNNDNKNIIIKVIKPTISLNFSLPSFAETDTDIGKIITSTYNQTIVRVKNEEEGSCIKEFYPKKV